MGKCRWSAFVVVLAAGALTVPLAVTGTVAATAQPMPVNSAQQLAQSVRPPAGIRPRVFIPPLRVPDPAAYAQAKAEADAAAGEQAPAVPVTPSAPSLVHSWQGINDTAHAPSDSTSAVGTSRFIELINSDVAIYNKTSTTPIDVESLLALTGCVTGFGCTDSVFDPQIIWDPGTKRFFYAADDVIDSTHNFLAFGFSKTASPTSSADWCPYNLSFGASFPDYPKLGDTKNFQLIGVNIFNGSSFGGSDVAWLSKPAAGSTCPAASTFKFGTAVGLKNADGSQAFTPVPANQIDTSSTGWIVARPASLPSAGATFLTVFKVTKSSTGAAVIPITGSTVAVAAYKVPASAPQLGTTNKLDTSDTRNTQAVSAIDPAHGTAVGLWTQHTVLGGAGAEVRWYEINPVAHTLFQSGTLTSPSLFTFNGAISPDRVVNGTTKLFGSNMVLDANTTSSSTQSTLEIVSKLAAGAQSAPLTVAHSSGPDIGFDCASGTCRWGDYASATPDPSITTGSAGVIWGTSMLTFQSSDTSSANWATWNFAANP
jgi:hypothetical protein